MANANVSKFPEILSKVKVWAGFISHHYGMLGQDTEAGLNFTHGIWEYMDVCGLKQKSNTQSKCSQISRTHTNEYSSRETITKGKTINSVAVGVKVYLYIQMFKTCNKVIASMYLNH